MGLFGETCIRCAKKRTKKTFEGSPTCEPCELKIQADREEVRPCPIDSNPMIKEIVQNIIIDRCEQCGGVWLDGGELKVIKKNLAEDANGKFASGMVLGMVIG